MASGSMPLPVRYLRSLEPSGWCCLSGLPCPYHVPINSPVRQLTPLHHQPPVLMGPLGRIRSLNSLAVSDSMLRRAIASLTADPSHHSVRCLLDKYFGVLENCPFIGLLLSYMDFARPKASLITKSRCAQDSSESSGFLVRTGRSEER